MTQQSLADKLGVRFQQIQKYECAHNAMNIPRLMQICEATGVHPDFFFHGLPIWDRITKNTKVPDEELSIELVQLAMKIGRLSEKKRESLNAMIDTMLEEV
jgi:transcriptional regulator with XRE-family HTH domain